MVSPHVQYFGKSQHYKQFVIGQVKAAFFGQSQCVTHVLKFTQIYSICGARLPLGMFSFFAIENKLSMNEQHYYALTMLDEKIDTGSIIIKNLF